VVSLRIGKRGCQYLADNLVGFKGIQSVSRPVRAQAGLCFFKRDVEKVLPWIFSTTEPENAISRFLHFQ